MAMAETAATEEKLDFKRILPVFIIVLVDLLGLTIILPVLPLYAVSFGADAVAIGLLATAYPLFQLVGGPLLGTLSDRYGRRPVLVISQAGTLVALLMLGFAEAMAVLFLSRILDGFTGGNIVTAQAAITDLTTPRTRTQGLGLIGAAFGLGFTMGPAIAGISLALTNNDYRAPALAAAAFSFVALLLTIFWFKETLPPEKRGQSEKRQRPNLLDSLRRVIQTPYVGALLALMFFQQLIFYGFEALLALFNLSRLGLDAAGNAVVFVFVGIILVLVQGKYIGPWSRRYGERRLIYAGLGLLALGLTLTAVTPAIPVTWYDPASILKDGAEAAAVPLPATDSKGWLGLIWLMVAMIPTSIGGGILTPSINSLLTKLTPPTQAGSTLGVSASLVSLANTVTPLLGGAIFQFLGTTAPFLIGGGLMGVLLVMALRHLHASLDQVSKPHPVAEAA